MDWNRAANDLAALLAPACAQVAVVGDIRRGRPQVTRIEILAAPRMTGAVMTPLPGFDVADRHEVINHLESRLSLLQKQGVLGILLGAKKSNDYREYLYGRFPVRLYTCIPPQQWGVMLALLSSPEKLTKRMTRSRDSGGLLPSGWSIRQTGVIVRSDGVELAAPDEPAFFTALGLPFVPPERRR